MLYASALPALPFTDPVLIVAVAAAVFLVVPIVFERLRVPGIIGLILAGAAIGPHGAGILARDATIVLLGTVGLLYLMLMVGLELDLEDFARFRAKSLAFGVLSFLVPAVAGTGIALLLGYSVLSALLVASAFASHTLLAYPVAQRLGIVRNEAVTVSLGGTILTEVLALVLLAVVANAAQGGLDAGIVVRLGGPFALYVAAVLLGLPRLGRWFFRHARGGAAEYLFVMTAVFGVAYLAHAAGVEPIVGALLAGLALNRLVPEHGTLMSRIHFVGNALFIPFFLLSVGMLVDARALDSPRAWRTSLALAAGVLVSKWAAAWIAGRLLGWSGDETRVVYGLTVPHAAGTLAIVLIGFEVGLLDQAEVNGVFVVILASCIVGPWAVERWGRRVALRDAERPRPTGRAPRRVLVPLANPATADALIDLALAVRGKDTAEPLHPLLVVDRGSPAHVAEAERMLSHAVAHAAAAEVPVVPLTRVDANVAEGIARAAAETRSAAVVTGWDGRLTAHGVIFGSVLDQLLESTRRLVVVARMGRPLAAVRRVLAVVPPGAERHPGFEAAARALQGVSRSSGAPLTVLAVGGGAAERVRALMAALRPTVQAVWEEAEGWRELTASLRSRVEPDDMVVLMSARHGTLAWHPRLERLPALLATLPSECFAVVYPPEADEEADGADGGTDSLAALSPHGVVALEADTFAGAMAELTARAVDDPALAERLAGALVRQEDEWSSEVLPGVAVPHVRSAALSHGVLVVGTSRQGVSFPHARRPVRLVFLLLSPADRAEEHLRSLAGIARLLADPARVEELLGELAPDAPLDWLHVDEA